MPNPVDEARAAGYTDQEINDFLAPRFNEARQAGYTDQEIQQYLGIKPAPPLNEAPIRAAIRQNLDASAKPVTSFTDALEAGWQISVAGLATRGELPNKAIAASAPWYSRIAASAASIAGDIPAMLAGAVAGGGTTAPSGPGAVIGATAGAFALPATLRSAMMDAYKHGSSMSWEDAWPRLSGIFMDTAKGWLTGAATGAAGLAAPLALPAAVSPAVRATTQTAAEIGAMVTVGQALEGHVPSAQDFVDAAIMIGGVKFATAGAARLRSIYRELGVDPRAVLQDARTDPTIAQDLIGGETTPRAYQQPGINVEIRATRDGEPITPTGGAEPPPPPSGGAVATPAPEQPPQPFRTLAEAQDRIRQHISVGEQDPQGRMTWDRLYTMTVDKLHPLDVAQEAAGRELPPNAMPAGPDPYKLGRLVAGSSGVAHSFLEFGTRDFASNETNGPGLRSILEPVAQDLDGFRLFATSFRAMELENRGIATGFDLDAARQVVENGLDNPQFKATLQGLLDYQDKTAQYLRDSGVLSRAGYEAMREANRLYVPFQRVMESGSPIGIRISPNDLQARNPIKGIVGSERRVIDPLESIIRNTYLFAQMAQRNEVGVKLVDLLKKADEAGARRVSDTGIDRTAAVQEMAEAGVDRASDLADLVAGTRQPVRTDEIRVFRNGRPETYQVTRDLAEAFRGLDVESANLIERMLGAPARALRAGAVLTPDFMSRNLMRDFMTAFVNTTKGVFTPIDTMRGLAGVLRQDKDYQDWYASGGANAALNALDRDYLQTSLRQLTEETGLMTRAWNVVRHPVDFLRMLSQVSEEATRLGVYKKIMQEGEGRGAMQEAAFASREATLDFARMGSKMRAMNMIAAFFNAQVQGVDRTVRQFQDAPLGTSMRVLGGITIPSVLLWWANHDDPRWDEIPSWQKDMFWIVMTKDNIYRIPKPFELGVLFGSGPERILDAYMRDKPKAFRDFGGSVAGALLPGFVPTIAQPLIEQYANRDLFRGHSLVPAAMEKFLPEYQYTPYTTETTKALGQILGAFPGVRDASLEQQSLTGAVARAITSPIMMENYIRAWTGGLGMYALQAADAGLRKAGVVANPVQPEKTLADIPFIRAFVVRYPSASAAPIQNFTDDYQKNEAYFQTFMGMARQGDAAAAERVAQIGGMVPFARLQGIQQVLTDQTHLVQAIYRNPDITPAEKRQLIDQAYFTMLQVAQAGNETLRMVKQGIGTVDAPAGPAAPAPAPAPRAPRLPAAATE